jgi:predicted RNase H-like HicB family nuclease
MQDATHFMSLPYTRVLTTDEDGTVIARIQELPGCTAHGANDAEAIENLRDVQLAWIEEAINNDIPIPQPSVDQDLPSGKWVQRVPKWLHARLVTAATEEGTSLNQFVSSLLSEGLALRNAWRNPPTKMVKAAMTHTWAKQEAQRPGHYAYAPETQTDTTAVEVLRRSGDTAAATPIEKYRDRKKK